MNSILSQRLRTLAGMVPAGSIPADIGTDHGYIPIYLVQEGIAPKALAMDVRPGPLERAREHIEGSALAGKITVRLSDGLTNLEPGEADTLIIAGMGGALIERILTRGKQEGSLAGIRTLLLGPQSEPARVRSWILANGYVFDAEEMVEEDGKYYPLIRAVAGERPDFAGAQDLPQPFGCGQDVRAFLLSSAETSEQGMQDGTGAAMWEEVLLEYGPVLLAGRHPVLHAFLQREERLCERIRQQIDEKGSAGTNEKRLEELSLRLERIRLAYRFYQERSR